jgi:pimeloyl-ACP methyl ester carboxylesterase
MAWRGLGPAGYHRLHAIEWGSRRSGRVVICAHGYSGNGRDFDWLAHELAREARVVCPDMPGRGRSDWLPNALAYNFPQFLADLRTLIAELGATEVEWVGTSMGGLLGLLLAAQPGSPISRLVLNDVGAFVPSEALARIGRNLQAPKLFDSMAALEAHLRHTHRHWGAITDKQWAHLARHGARRVEGGFAMHYDPLIAMLMNAPVLSPGLSLWSTWYRVRCPVLIVRGETSEILPPAVVQGMLDARPGTGYLEVAGAGHAPSLMAPGEVRAIADFLRAPVTAAQGIEPSYVGTNARA